MFKNWKVYVRVLLGGSVAYLLGSFLLPYINQFLSSIPATDFIFKGFTPHVMIAFGLGYFAGDYLNEKFLKL